MGRSFEDKGSTLGSKAVLHYAIAFAVWEYYICCGEPDEVECQAKASTDYLLPPQACKSRRSLTFTCRLI